MRPLAHRALALSVLLALALPASASAQPADVTSVPPPTRWVTDTVGFLSPATREALDRKLQAYEQETGHQVIVWIGRTTGGIPVEDWAARAFQAWRVGRKGLDDGLVLFIFAEDRRMRIEVGYGLEDRVPDAVASRVIREALTPGFRAGRNDAAVSLGVDALLAAIEGKPFGVGGSGRPGESPGASGGQLLVLAFVVLAFLVLLIINPGMALSLLFILSSGGRGRGFSSGRGGGGGGFGGGGGRSGGGGASGSW